VSKTTSTGTIQMIRKSFDDTIEQFDVDGGNLIDDDGTWSPNTYEFRLRGNKRIW
jgi:hypothetical protein